ncbi:MAG: hypothetical protein LKJ05_02840 [Bifidobacteriaceae bacterium]|jgi:hypothetical protein|nr:hypothetical protein [Bifidobacteriaceae bacterium]
MASIGAHKLPVPASSADPNIPSDLTKLATAVDSALTSVASTAASDTKSVRDSLSQTGTLTPVSGWKAYQPMNAQVLGKRCFLAGAVQRTSATFTATAWDPKDVAKVSPAPTQRFDFAVPTNAPGSNGIANIRIGTDGVVYVMNTHSDKMEITQNESWFSLAGINYQIK